MGDCCAGNAPSLLWFRPAPMRILRGGLPMGLDALLYLGMGHGKHAVHKIRKRVVF